MASRASTKERPTPPAKRRKADAGFRPMLSRTEVADLLGVDIRTVTRFIADGRIRSVTIGGRRMIAPEEMDRLQREGTGQ
jgi:excisionase family DNA binding protein